jgi:transposase
MSMKPSEDQGVPEETRKVAKAVFPKGNVYLWMRDEIGELYRDALFADLYSSRGQPTFSPGRLALVSVMQYMEGLTDRQAAEAVRARIDWKYALGLELADPGFDFSILSEFRHRLATSQEKQLLLNILLEELVKRGWIKAGGKQRSDSTHVLAAIRDLNRLELIGETMRRALNELAEADPAWLQQVVPPEWYPRYAQRMDPLRFPKKAEERQALLITMGQDGFYLMETLLQAEEKRALWKLAGVDILRQVWLQQFWIEYPGNDDHYDLHPRESDNQPPGDRRIHSPYDLDARYSAKGSTEWVGFKAHLTETCDDDQPHVITNVETTLAVEQDVSVTECIHTALEAKHLLPNEHLLDAGYIDAELLVSAQDDYGITICGPVKKDVRWQANEAEGFSLAQFQIDWEHRTVTCPQGKVSHAWSVQKNAYGTTVNAVKFQPSDCKACPVRVRCTRSKSGPRYLLILSQAQHEALQKARQAQKTAEFWKRYAKRSGIEGTISQGVRAFDLRCSRYIGLLKTNVQMVLTAVAIDLYRLYNWVREAPIALTRTSHFASLAPDPALVSGSWRVA